MTDDLQAGLDQLLPFTEGRPLSSVTKHRIVGGSSKQDNCLQRNCNKSKLTAQDRYYNA